MYRFAGLSREKIKSANSAEKERKNSIPPVSAAEIEKKAEFKAQEILAEHGKLPAPSGKPGEEMDGSEGRVQSILVEDIMVDRVATVKLDDSISTARAIFEKVRFHHLPVIDDAGTLVGIVSDRDILSAVSPFLGTINEQNRDVAILKRPVNTIMTRNPLCAEPGAAITDAVRMMHAGNISCLPVVKEPEKIILGIITWKDVARAFCPAGFRQQKQT